MGIVLVARDRARFAVRTNTNYETCATRLCDLVEQLLKE